MTSTIVIGIIFLNNTYPNSIETPLEFYKNVYNEDISDFLNKQSKSLINNNSGEIKIPTYIYITVAIIILVIIILIFVL